MTGSQHPSQASASCYCRAVKLNFEADHVRVVHCHCGECRRLSGAAFTTWVSVHRQPMRICGEASLSSFQVTPNVTRRFCRVCGSHMFSSDVRLAQTVGIPAGVIDGVLSNLPRAHYFVDHKAAWHSIDDALPRFGGPTGATPTLA